MSESAFPRWPLARGVEDGRAYLEWFNGAPASVESYMAVALVDGEVVTVTSGVLIPARVCGEVWMGGFGGTGHATRPGAQQRGLRTAVREFTDAQMPSPLLVLLLVERPPVNDPTRTVIPLGDEFTYFLKVLHPRRAAQSRPGNRYVNSLGYAALQFRGGLRRRRPKQDVPWTVRSVSAFDKRLDRFIEEAAEPWDFIALVSSAYLNWRYLDPRAGVFHALVAEQDGRLLGYLIYCDRWGRGDVVDLLALPGRTDVVRSLLDAAVERLDEGGASAIECRLMRRHPYAEVLARTGFVRRRGRSREIDRLLTLYAIGPVPDGADALTRPGAALHIVHGQFDEV